MINIAVLGFGVVGSGVVELLEKNGSSIADRAGEKIAVKKILDIRDFKGSPFESLVTNNADDIFNDDSIRVVVETIGGAKIAYEFTKRAIKSGKHVVTSNKELVATYGPELLELAKENGVNYLFEASVGGGIPIIRPLYQCLTADKILRVTGILNGTTNYILTRMKNEGLRYEDALKEAQQKGYAEANPAADIEGHDACRKIAILSSIAYNEYVDCNNIYTEGISKISTEDMEYAEYMNSSIKLIGISERLPEGIFARVSPALVSRENPLSGVEDVFNAIVVRGNALGDAMFYGKGAGKFPTASAVVADVVDAVKNIDSNNNVTWNVVQGNNLIDISESKTRMFIRIKSEDTAETAKEAHKYFEGVKKITIDNPNVQGEFAFTTGLMTEKDIINGARKLRESGSAGEVINMIRILG